jgi:hypothetical protein
MINTRLRNPPATPPEEISVTAEHNVVTIEGRKAANTGREFLYQGIFRATLQAPIQPCRLRAGEERRLRQPFADDRIAPGDSRGHEAAADSHHWRTRFYSGVPLHTDNGYNLVRCAAWIRSFVRLIRSKSMT